MDRFDLLRRKKRKEKKEEDDLRDDSIELDEGDLPIHERFIENKKLRKIKK